MNNLPRSTAKDVFSHLLAIVTLFMGVISFIALYFQYVNIKFPDVLSFYYPGSLEIIRQCMAILIVAWPVFILITWMIYRDLRGEPAKINIGIRKWLQYLTLFVASLTIIIDLITLIRYFLDGEITARFVLKVLVVLLTAAAVFGYYLWDLKRDVAEKTKITLYVTITTVVVVLITIVLGFFVAGSPVEQRRVRLDAQRVENLSMIQNEAINYFSLKRELPANLETLNNSLSGFSVPADPETKLSYEYTMKSDLVFELCATFSTKSQENQGYSFPMYYGSTYGQNWDHEAGRVCFERTIDPELYPPVSTVKGEILDF
jgi:hypothetical protein